MAQLQKTLALLLGDDVCPLEKRLKDSVVRRRLEDGKPFPQQLLGILTLSDEQLKKGASAWSLNLERALNRVNDALAILQLGRERGLSVAQPLSIVIVAPSCDEAGRTHLLEVLELIHRTCRANQFLYQSNAFLLLPGLFEGREDIDPQLLRARALVTLWQLQHVMRDRSEPPWEDNAPLNTIWLVDARNERGEFIGYLNQSLDMISEMIVSLATGDLEGLYPQGSGGAEDGRFFRAFGYAQLELPLGILEQQLIERFVCYVLGRRVLRRERIDSNEVLLTVKQFCHDERFTLQGLLNHLEKKPDGAFLLMPFVAEIEATLPPPAYVEALEQQAETYEKGPAIQAKRSLHQRAEEVFKELIELIHAKVTELVDTHPSGIFYAQAFLEELVGEGEQSQLTEGPRLDVPTNLQSRQQELVDQLFQDLGIPKYREALRHIEVRLANCKEELQLCETQLKEQEERAAAEKKSGKTQAAALEALRKKLQELKDEKKRLEAKKAKLQDLLSLTTRALEDIETRNALRQRVEEERRAQLQATREALFQDGQELQVTRQELAHLLEQRPHLARRYFLHYPLALGAGILVTLLALIVSGSVSLTTALFSPLTWQFSLLLMAAYFLWAWWRFYRRIIAKQRELENYMKTLAQRIDAGKLALRDGYHRLFQDLFIQHRDNVALSHIQELIKHCQGMLSQLRAFRETLHSWQNVAAQQPTQPEDSLARISLLRSEHYEVLFESLLREDLDREAGRCLEPNFGGVRISSLVEASESGANTLIQALQSWGQKLVRRKLDGFGVEELLWAEQFAELRHRMQLAPEGITRLLIGISPAVQLQDSTGVSITKHYAIGVPDAQRSWLRELLAGHNYNIFSHRDPARLITFCVTSRFPLEALSQLGFYREAFQALWPRRTEGLQLPQTQMESLLTDIGVAEAAPSNRSVPSVLRKGKVQDRSPR